MMIKRNIRIRALVLIMAACIVTGGCGSTGDTDMTSLIQDVTDAASVEPENSAVDQAGGDTSDPVDIPKPAPGSSDTAGSLTPEDVPYIEVECINHNAMLSSDDGTGLVTGSYYEFKMSETSALAYPKLAELITTLNEQAYSDIVSEMQGMETDSQQMHDNGWGTPFEEAHFATITRADSKVFSYCETRDSYRGGAHGYRYSVTANYDPVTGEKIDFFDVVTDTEDFADIAFEELIKSNEDMADYFDSLPGDKDSLYERIDEYISGEEVTLPWSMDQEGIWIYYPDYGMGSYAAGARDEHIPYADHPEIFNDSYFTFDGKKALEAGLPDISTYVTQTYDEEYAPIPSGGGLLDVYYDVYGDGHYQAKPYYAGNADLIGVSDVHPALAARLDRYNESNKKRLKNDFAGYPDAITKEYNKRYSGGASDGREYDTYGYGISLYQQRADGTVFSWVESVYEDHIDDCSTRTLTGMNLDTATGDDIGLGDVITDIPAFEAAVKEQLTGEGYIRDVTDRICDELHKRVADRSLVSSERLSWVLGYEGLTVYFNTTENYNVFGTPDTAFCVFLPYSRYTDMFETKYTKVPGGYAYQVPVSDTFGSETSLTLEYDGNYYKVGFEPKKDEYGNITALDVTAEGNITTIDRLYAYNISVFIIHGSYDDNYIYLQCPAEDGYTSIRVFTIGFGGKPYENTDEDIWGAVRYSSVQNDEMKRGYTMTAARKFHMRMVDSVLGMRDVYAECAMDYDGTPKSMDGWWYYRGFEGSRVTANHEFRADMIDENGDVIRETRIESGAVLEPYRISELDKGDRDWNTGITIRDYDRDIEFKDDHGNIFRLHIEGENTYDYYFRGEKLQDMLEGMFVYAG